MFYLERKERVKARIKDPYGFEKVKTVSRWRAVECSDTREKLELFLSAKSATAQKGYRITEVKE